MKHAFDGLISRLDIAEERISELDDNDNINFQNCKAKRKKTGGKKKTEQNIQGPCYKRGNIHIQIPEEEKQERKGSNI